MSDPHKLTRMDVLLLAISFEGGILLIALMLGWLLGRSVIGPSDFSLRAIALGVIATIPLFAVLTWSMRSRLPALRRLRREVDDVLLPVFARCRLADIALISLLAGLGEEALFRGLIQTALTEAIGPWMGLATASLLFGLAHLITPTYALLASLIGAYLGWLFAASNNLLIPITVHSVYDFGALTFLLLQHRARVQNERPSGDDAGG